MITKAIIPVAGIGSRFLPASKSIPKEMFPLVDKPVIHYIVKEAVESGIRDIIFVTSAAKKSVEDYFDVNFELEYRLDKKGKSEFKSAIHEMADWANFYFIRQSEPLGDGDAILRASGLLGQDQAFAVMWGDDVIISEVPVIKQLIAVYEKYKSPVFAIEEIHGKAIERYGVINGKEIEPCVYQVSGIIEKPKLEEAPSNLGIVGHYIITPDVLEALKKQEFDKRGEIGLAYALHDTVKRLPVYGYKFSGARYDCGNKLGWLKANVALGLEDYEIGQELGEFLKQETSNFKYQMPNQIQMSNVKMHGES